MVELLLFTTRHSYALPPQIVGDPPHRQVMMPHLTGSRTHPFKNLHMDFVEFVFSALR